MTDTTTARREALEQVRRILIDNLKIDREPHEIDPDVPLFGTGLGLDSVDAVELVVALEGALTLKMPEETQAPVHLRTVNTVVDFILHHRGHPRAEPLRGEASDDKEMNAMRSATAFSRLDEMLAVKVSGADPFERVDPLVTNDLFMRDGQMRQGLLLDDDAHPIGDLYVAHDDDNLILLIEGQDRDGLDAFLRDAFPKDTQLERLYETRSFVSIHGPWAWELMTRVLGEDLVALPYLGFFALEDDTEGICFRGGKTGEFGYDVLLPKERTNAFVARLMEAGREFDLLEIRADTLAQAKREAFFFDPSHYRGVDVTPLELQLRWRCSNRKPYRGRDALDVRKEGGRGRAAGAPKQASRLTCLTSATPLRPAADVLFHNERVGEILHAGPCSAGGFVAHALLQLTHAEVGLEHQVDGHLARAVAPPVIENQSLKVDPRKHTYREHVSATSLAMNEADE